MRVVPKAALALGLVAVCAVVSAQTGSSAVPNPKTPIEHVVIIDMENQSFDAVLGAWCSSTGRCDGATTGKTITNATIPLKRPPDIVPDARHQIADQRAAINGGLMNGFSAVGPCKAPNYQCYINWQPDQVPNVISLANAYVVGDRMFELDQVPSYGSHLELVTGGNLAGFTGDNPTKIGRPGGRRGWGCDSFRDAPWQGSGTEVQWVPACVPKPDGSGPYRPSPVPWIDTLMNRMDAKGLSWKIYAGVYSWAICPTFADCLYTAQASKLLKDSPFLTDATSGNLPALSILTPSASNSQHNFESMTKGDNWLGTVFRTLMASPQWKSTAVFLTWDDCGCFYDHVAPPAGLGVRVPLVVVSNYAKVGYTEHNVASFASLPAFVEHNWGLAPIGPDDAVAYDLMGSFDFTKSRPRSVTLVQQPVPASSETWLKAHPRDLTSEDWIT